MVFHLAGLVAGLGLGALAEVTKRQLGFGKTGKRQRETVCVAACNQVKDEFNDGAVFHSPSCNIIMVPNYMIVLPSWKEGTGDDDDEEHCYGVRRGGMGGGGEWVLLEHFL